MATLQEGFNRFLVLLLSRKNGGGRVQMEGSDIVETLLQKLDAAFVSSHIGWRVMLFSHIAITIADDMLVIGMSPLHKVRL
jgi:hypothetical protein